MVEASQSPAGSIGEVLIIDEDRSLAQQLVSFLSARDWHAQAVSPSEEVLALVDHGHWSLIVLDIEPSGGNGLDRLRRVRSISDIPVLVTGRNLTPTDRILALELGADGYILKPFDLHELWSHARAIERRQKLARFQAGRQERGAYRFSGWTLTLSDSRLIDPAGHPVRLYRSTYALLIAFLDAPRRPLSRSYLLRAIQASEDVFDRCIDVRVMRLRRALQQGGAPKGLIKTESGFGYVFDAVVERIH
ncbi:response regulator [Bradyrhizobium sp. Ai1a-2]|uniref:response regulator n=1 Tax=Bradyrhizobium sp. Ai1a-2 TaxID=196490 RepID=UPI0007E8DDF3|nr:response regulator [Bradyrhizobium sp. Ai1a-2]